MVYKPNFPETSTPVQNSTDQSMLNLYLKEEANQTQIGESTGVKLSRSVFNLYEKPTFPAEKEASESATERSMMNLYLKEEQSQSIIEQNRLARSVFNLYEKP